MMPRQLVVSVIASLKRTASQAARMAILRLVIKSVCSRRRDGMIKAPDFFVRVHGMNTVSTTPQMSHQRRSSALRQIITRGTGDMWETWYDALCNLVMVFIRHQQPVWGEHGINKLANYISLHVVSCSLVQPGKNGLCRLLETFKMSSSCLGFRKYQT